MYLFLAFLMVPIIEIALFIQVGGAIGLVPTLAIVILTAIAGTWLVKTQGRMAIAQLGQSFNELRDPTEPLAHGAMILVAGVLLLTPGFFTDAVGFALLIPSVRHAAFRFLAKRVKVQRFSMGPGPQPGPQHPRGPQGGQVIDGEFEDVSPEPRVNRGPSGWTSDPDQPSNRH